jgi:hypothetical protein
VSEDFCLKITKFYRINAKKFKKKCLSQPVFQINIKRLPIRKKTIHPKNKKIIMASKIMKHKR